MFSLINKRKASKGFTLIELMIVFAIIGILALVLVPKIGNTKTSAKEAGVLANARQLQALTETVIDDFSPSSGETFDVFLMRKLKGNTMANPITGVNNIYNWNYNSGERLDYAKTYSVIVFMHDYAVRTVQQGKAATMPNIIEQMRIDWATESFIDIKFKGIVVAAWTSIPGEYGKYMVRLYSTGAFGQSLNSKSASSILEISN